MCILYRESHNRVDDEVIIPVTVWINCMPQFRMSLSRCRVWLENLTLTLTPTTVSSSFSLFLVALTVLCTGEQNRRFRDESFTESLRDRERGNSYLPHFLILFCSTCFFFFFLSLLLFFFLSSFTSIFTILYLISIRCRFPCNGTLSTVVEVHFSLLQERRTSSREEMFGYLTKC